MVVETDKVLERLWRNEDAHAQFATCLDETVRQARLQLQMAKLRAFQLDSVRKWCVVPEKSRPGCHVGDELANFISN